MDVSQLDRVYNKSKLAVKIVQEYDKSTNSKYLTDITTITPISKQGVYGLYNSSENKAVLGKQYNKQKYTFTQDQLDKMSKLPEDILRQHKVPEEVIQAIQPTDTIHVNVLSIYKTFNDLQKAGKISPEEAQSTSSGKLLVRLFMRVNMMPKDARQEKPVNPVQRLRNKSSTLGSNLILVC